MKVRELYAFLNEKIPPSLSCEWDNDGLMCCPDADAEVCNVLIALDITDRVIDLAVTGGYDVIVAHHPLIFSPLKAVEPSDHIARRVIRLIRAGITAMSFHTRLDTVEGGVNDTLARALGLCDVQPFGDGCGRIGRLPDAMSAADFATLVKKATGADQVQVSDSGHPVLRVAVLGGSGSSDVADAADAGADTYLSGELKHNVLTDAPECGINLVAAGHFHTEDLVCKTLCKWISDAFPSLQVDVTVSNTVQIF